MHSYYIFKHKNPSQTSSDLYPPISDNIKTTGRWIGAHCATVQRSAVEACPGCYFITYQPSKGVKTGSEKVAQRESVQEVCLNEGTVTKCTPWWKLPKATATSHCKKCSRNTIKTPKWNFESRRGPHQCPEKQYQTAGFSAWLHVYLFTFQMRKMCNSWWMYQI